MVKHCNMATLYIVTYDEGNLCSCILLDTGGGADSHDHDQCSLIGSYIFVRRR